MPAPLNIFWRPFGLIFDIISLFTHNIVADGFTSHAIYGQFGGTGMATRSLTIRIDDKLLDKLHVVADYEGRSANSQVLILIRDCVKQFERENGEIETRR